MKISINILFPTLISLIICAFLIQSCNVRFTAEPNIKLSFSEDTVSFDTVFTAMTTITRTVRVYNAEKHAVKIERVWLQNDNYFQVNLDGEAAKERWQNLTLEGGDSLFVFVKVNIEKIGNEGVKYIADKLLFSVNGSLSELVLEAYGEDVCKLDKVIYEGDMLFSATKPYLIMDTVLIYGNTVIEAGTKLYMHQNACIFCLGNFTAIGNLNSRITIQGDRRDEIMTDVPYSYVSGSWNGIYLLAQGEDERKYELSYVELKSGTVGLYCVSDRTESLPSLSMKNCRIHNFSSYGVVLQNIDACLLQNEISNCASYGIYMSGGKYELVHNTIAQYFQSMNIQPVSREDVAAVYLNDLSKRSARTEGKFYNNIITGSRANNLVIATPLPSHYVGEFRGNYLRSDSLPDAIASDNVYYQTNDTVFLNTGIHRAESGEGYEYYDFRLDSLSKARGVALEEYTKLYLLDSDRLGTQRDTLPDAGCYEWQPIK